METYAFDSTRRLMYAVAAVYDRLMHARARTQTQTPTQNRPTALQRAQDGA